VTDRDYLGETQRQAAHATQAWPRLAGPERELPELWHRHAELERA